MLAEDPDAVRGIVAINLLGALNTVEPLIEPMCARGRGRIALTGSIAALRGLPYSPAYCATKAAVHLYADSLRGNLRKSGVGVSLIVPGFVNTPLNSDLVAFKPLRDVRHEGGARSSRAGSIADARSSPFQRILYWAARLSTFLPAGLADAILARFDVEMRVTHERALPETRPLMSGAADWWVAAAVWVALSLGALIASRPRSRWRARCCAAAAADQVRGRAGQRRDPRQALDAGFDDRPGLRPARICPTGPRSS